MSIIERDKKKHWVLIDFNVFPSFFRHYFADVLGINDISF